MMVYVSVFVLSYLSMYTLLVPILSKVNAVQPLQVRLLSMLEEYMAVREEKEHAKKRQRVLIFC